MPVDQCLVGQAKCAATVIAVSMISETVSAMNMIFLLGVLCVRPVIHTYRSVAYPEGSESVIGTPVDHRPGVDC